MVLLLVFMKYVLLCCIAFMNDWQDINVFNKIDNINGLITISTLRAYIRCIRGTNGKEQEDRPTCVSASGLAASLPRILLHQSIAKGVCLDLISA